VASHLRERILWAKLNLQDDEIRRIRDLDVIFCRNVLIYFDRPSVQAVLSRLIQSLKPGGLLMLGSSEGALVQQQAQSLGLERLDGAVFRKIEL
jgi:chemotaxis protein methyltransferase CheR